jgi:pimeloyl-ACP methyl ester carboxylesterase
MKKIISLLFLISLFACQNSGDKNKNAGQENIKDTAVNEQTYIALGGEEQYVEITGASSKNPVLLFLHGGPGWPQTPHLRYFNADLTKSVTLVAWEQAGCGKSFMRNPNPKNLSVAQLINDAHELTQILKKKFQQDKIYLAGFSWGSVIGLQLVQKYPEDYAAYFGISQVIDINRSITLSREWLKEQATLKGDKKMLKQVAQLEKMDTALCSSNLECFFKKYEFLTEYGGAIHNKAVEAEIKIAETKYEDYKKYDWINGFMYSCGRLGEAVFETNLTGITELKVPAYFFIGKHDKGLLPIVTEDFVNKLKAPAKEIVWFENSSHEPLEEEAALFNKIMAERITVK